MKAQILTTATLLTFFAGALSAADQRLLNLVMPDATVLAGVNVAQAKATPFGQYVLTTLLQSQAQQLQQFATLTGFDPRRDVNELLFASNSSAGNKTGLAMALGAFDPTKIAAAAQLAGGGVETYGGVSIIEDPQKQAGLAFLDSTLVVAGDLASVKAAIDRRGGGSTIPAALAAQVNQLSTTEDAWAITNVPPSTLGPTGVAPVAPAPPAAGANLQKALQQIQSASGGVKLGSVVALTVQAQTATAQDALQLGAVLQMLVSMAQLSASKNPEAAALAQALAVSTQGSAVKITLSVPEDQIQQLMRPQPAAHKVVQM
jgi:tellurite resistance protein